LDAIKNNLRLELERRKESFRAEEKPQVSRKNKLVCFSVCPAVFPCALRAQVGRLRRPARKRWTTLLFQLAFAAFTAANGVSLLLSLTQREKTSRPFPALFPPVPEAVGALLFQLAFAAFTATNGVFCFSL